MKIIVISECVDAATGRRYQPGEVFPDGDAVQVNRLVRANCLAPAGDPAAKLAAAQLAAREAGSAQAREVLERARTAAATAVTAETTRLNDEIAALDKRRAEAEAAAELAEQRRLEAEESASLAEKRRDQHEIAASEANDRRGAAERALAEAQRAAEEAAADAARKAKKG